MKFLKGVIVSTLLLTTTLQNVWSADESEDCCGPSWLRNLLPSKESAETTIAIETAQFAARRLIANETFIVIKEENTPTFKSLTTLNKMLTAHDELHSLVTSASSFRNGIRNTTAFPADVFKALQSKERSLRIMVNLIWRALMIDNDSDRQLEILMSGRNISYLFQGKGFENESKRAYHPLGYSFPDDGNSVTHVAQIRTLAEALEVDFDAEIYLPFDPQNIDHAEMSSASFGGTMDVENESVTESGFCILNALKVKDNDAERKEPHTAFAGDLYEYGGDEAHISVSMSSLTKDNEEEDTKSVATSTSRALDLEKLKRIRDLLKFNLLMERVEAGHLSSEPRDYIPRIIARMQGHSATANHSPFTSKGIGSFDVAAQLTEEMMQHHLYLTIPSDSFLKPTTVSTYVKSVQPLEIYWERTEAALADAERIIASDASVAANAEVKELRDVELNDRVKNLIVHTLLAIQNFKIKHNVTTGSQLVDHMLGNLHVPRRGKASYPWTAEKMEAIESLTESLQDLNMYPLGKNETEVRLRVLETLTTEFKQLRDGIL